MRARLLVVGMAIASCFREEDNDAGDATVAETTGDPSSTTASTTGESTGTPTSDPSGEAEAESSSVGDTTEGDDMCPFDSVPVPPIAEGWQGVDIITSLPIDAPPPDCPLQFSSSPELLGPLTEPELACDCECPTAMTDLCTMTIEQAGTCAALPGVIPQPLGDDCVPDTAAALRVVATGKAIEPVAQPRYMGEVLYACSGPPSLECAPRPAEFFGPCVRSSTETECPQGYPTPFTTWATACNPCVAPNTEGLCTTLQFDWQQANDCSDRSDAYLPEGMCVQDDTRHSLQVIPQQLDCGVTTGEPDSTLVCCVGQ